MINETKQEAVKWLRTLRVLALQTNYPLLAHLDIPGRPSVRDGEVRAPICTVLRPHAARLQSRGHRPRHC